MAAECDGLRRGLYAAGGIFDVHDIAPTFRTARVGMNVEAVIVLTGERQLFEEFSLRRSKFAARPLNSYLGLKVKLFAGVADRVIVIAAHRNPTFFDTVNNGLDEPFRIRAVAHMVTEQNTLLCAKIACLHQACFKCLAITVNIRE